MYDPEYALVPSSAPVPFSFPMPLSLLLPVLMCLTRRLRRSDDDLHLPAAATRVGDDLTHRGVLLGQFRPVRGVCRWCILVLFSPRPRSGNSLALRSRHARARTPASHARCLLAMRAPLSSSHCYLQVCPHVQRWACRWNGLSLGTLISHE